MTHQRSRQLPADHPATVHLAESRLNLAVLGFLGTAVFGPGRKDYWRHNLAAADHTAAGPAFGRMDELKAEVADLNRRLARQVLALESEEATPGLHRWSPTGSPTWSGPSRSDRTASTAWPLSFPLSPRPSTTSRGCSPSSPSLPDACPICPTNQLRAIFETLQLTVTYFHKTHEAEVEIVRVRLF